VGSIPGNGSAQAGLAQSPPSARWIQRRAFNVARALPSAVFTCYCVLPTGEALIAITARLRSAATRPRPSAVDAVCALPRVRARL